MRIAVIDARCALLCSLPRDAKLPMEHAPLLHVALETYLRGEQAAAVRPETIACVSDHRHQVGGRGASYHNYDE